MAKKIEEFMLSKDLQDKINQVSNLTQVHMDQLDASLKTLLTNIGNASQGVISYDDSELRNRVISLEKNSATKTGWFNKTSDKLTKEMLNAEMQSLIDDMQDFADALLTKLNISDADNKYRAKTEKLQLTDLSEEFQTQIRNIIDKVNALNTTFAGLNFVANDIEQLKRIISDLPNTAITRDFADARYRLQDQKITVNDVNDTLRPAIISLQSNYNKLDNVVVRNDLSEYRRLDNDINMSDLDTSIQAKLNTIDQLNANINARINTLVNQALAAGFVDTLKTTYVGDYALLNNTDYQDYIQNLLDNVNTNNKATVIQSLFALYKGLKDVAVSVASNNAQLNNVNTQFAYMATNNNYAKSLKDLDAVDVIKTLSYMSGLGSTLVDDITSDDAIETLSITGSTTIVQADTISASYTENAAKATTAYIGIASNAVHDCETIMHLEFPSVTNVNASAFKNCTNLNTVFLPSVKTIRDGAFVACDNIHTIMLPETYTFTGKEGLPQMCRIIRVAGPAVV